MTEVEVTLSVGDKFGVVSHETEVVTDLASEQSLVLRTFARVTPALRIEEDRPTGEPMIVGTNESRRAEFRVFSSGTPADQPTDLDHVLLDSALKVDWIGAKESDSSEDDLIVQSRRFAATLDTSGNLGARRAQVTLRTGQEILLVYALNWEVVSPISASPKIIALKPQQRSYRVVIRSHDLRPFRVLRIQCELSGIHFRTKGDAPAFIHVFEVECEIFTGKDATSVVSIFTDHPGQQRLDLPLVMID
jgi:hypothetical protein